MDKLQSSTHLIKLIYKYRKDPSLTPELVKQVCIFFDEMKNQELSQADLKFLHFLSIEAGIPQYFYMLSNFQADFSERGLDIDLDMFHLFAKESTLYTSENTYMHLYQKKILSLFKQLRQNRYFLSASTSFGKTHLVYEILRKMHYGNVMLVFPTIALLSENLMKIYLQKEYQWIKDAYNIHTLSDVDSLEGHNLFIYTPERYLSFLDKNNIPSDYFNFVFVDEAYKLDNEYLEEEERKENERDVAYRIAINYALSNENTDCLFAGPYIAFDKEDRDGYNPSFDIFLHTYNIELLNFNGLEIVQKIQYNLAAPTTINVNDRIVIDTKDKSKYKRCTETVKQLLEGGDSVIVYDYRVDFVENDARRLIFSGLFQEIDIKPFENLYNHLCHLFANKKGEEWIVTQALKYGIGVHHGLVPKYIQKEIVNLFNDGVLKVLICTTTLTEGINTTAKSVVVLSGNKGKHQLKKFDALNIEGRAGRFMQHYQGRVFVMDDEFYKALNGKDEFIKHKFFDILAEKKDVDLTYTNDAYLNPDDRELKADIEKQANEINLPDVIRNSNKTISLKDKVTLYRIVHEMSSEEIKAVKDLINGMTFGKYIESGFDVLCEKIKPIVTNGELYSLIDRYNYGHTILTYFVKYFFNGGLIGSINYYIETNGKIDSTVRRCSKFVYNTLKYQVTKYLGLFNVIYKDFISKVEGKDFADTPGLDKLLVRFEYNAETLLGRRVSDIGAAQKVISYFDSLEENSDRCKLILRSMDAYELENKKAIEKLLQIT